ncbi:hypothetical protein DPMN_053656 [Dreissena polymorpha]|uniref:Uncharacterized protein n=1 Tax=Dreissena polymorpha TaxID=45954 RepID=A0A9D4CLS2_DREPO|nr:hypothetical protein DPMN_053656 [Dreissena polymorpha]
MHNFHERSKCGRFLAQKNSSGQGGIRTRDLSITETAFYHYTTVSYSFLVCIISLEVVQAYECCRSCKVCALIGQYRLYTTTLRLA